jgi:hypothetical protein
MPCLLQIGLENLNQVGTSKRKKQKVEALVQSQKGAMYRFVKKKYTQVSSDNPTPEYGQVVHINIVNDLINPSSKECNIGTIPT